MKKNLQACAAVLAVLFITACGNGAAKNKAATEPAVTAAKEKAAEETTAAETTAPETAAAKMTEAETKAAVTETVPDPVKNNGGMYVKVGDDFWFRFYTVESNEKTALWGDFTDYPVPGSEKKMKCLKKDGTLADAFTDTGYGKIWYIDGLFYLTKRDNNKTAVTDHIYTVKPDGSEKTVLTNGDIEAYDPAEKLIVVKTRYAADGSYILTAWDLEKKTAREFLPGMSGEMTFHAIRDEKVLFDRTDYNAEPATCALYCADLKSGKTVKLADIPASDQYGGTVKVYETVFGKDKDTVYYSWGYLAGTGMMYQSGSAASVKISDPLNETYLTELPYSGLFAVDENKGIIEYETQDTDAFEKCFKVTMDLKTGKKTTGTEELTANETYLPYVPFYDRWYTGGLCMCREFLKKEVVVPDFIPDGGSDEEGVVTDMKNAEYADGKIFCTVNTSSVNREESVGWRTAYTLEHTELRMIDAETGKQQALCQSTAGTPQGKEGGENQESDRIGYVKDFTTDGDHGWFQFKPMLWIDGTDTETLKKYGIKPEDVFDDYELVDTGEKWEKVEWTMDDTKFTVQYDKNYEELAHPAREIDFAAFAKYMKKAPPLGDRVPDSAEERGILADVTLSGTISGRVLKVDEVYVP